MQFRKKKLNIPYLNDITGSLHGLEDMPRDPGRRAGRNSSRPDGRQPVRV